MDLSRPAAGLVLVVAVLAGCGDDDSAEADRSGTTEDTTTTSAPASTSAPATTDAQAAADADVRALAIWPRSSSTVTFATPEDVARSFALYYAQFREPIVGTYRPGDSTSGEVPILPFPDGGPETTVLVRQINDGTWYVVGSTTEDVAVTQPAAGASLQCPQPVAGTALAFEGQVEVRVDAFRPDGARVELGRGYVTGSGAPPAGPFSADISCRFPTEEVEGIAVLAFWTVDMAGDEGNTLQFVSMPLTLPG